MTPATSPRRSRKRSRTRGELVEAALALFEERGFDEVSVDAIAERADLARATFFLHFRAKHELLREWSRRLAAEAANAARERSGRESALAELRALLDRLGPPGGPRGRARGAMLRETLAASGSDEAGTAPDLLDHVESLIARGQRRGELRPPLEPRAAAGLFLGGVAALYSGALAPLAPARARDGLLDALAHGLRAPRPRLKWSPPAA